MLGMMRWVSSAPAGGGEATCLSLNCARRPALYKSQVHSMCKLPGKQHPALHPLPDFAAVDPVAEWAIDVDQPLEPQLPFAHTAPGWCSFPARGSGPVPGLRLADPVDLRRQLCIDQSPGLPLGHPCEPAPANAGAGAYWLMHPWPRLGQHLIDLERRGRNCLRP